MKGSLSRFIKKTSKIQRIAIISAIMVVIGAVASVSYIATHAAKDDSGMVFTTSDGLWNYVWDNENDYKITIVGYNGTDTTLTLPYKTYYHTHNGVTYSDVPVNFTAVDTLTNSYSFFTNMSRNDLVSVTIPTNITEIGDAVFFECTSLTTVKMHDNITKIGNNTFRECTSLASIDLPSNLTSIGNGTFTECTSLASIDLPSNLTSIGSYAFQNCTSLTSVKLPDSVTKIDYGAFYGCTSLTEINFPPKMTTIPGEFIANTGVKSISIPYGYTTISSYAFSNCSQLVNVVIPQSVTRIDYNAFSNCTALEKIVIPNSVTEFGSSMFYGCSSLKTVTLPKGLKEIPYGTFYNCTSLTEVKNINQITNIREDSFNKCTSLKTLDLPDTLTNIEWYAFANSGIDPCSLNLKNVSYISEYAFKGTTFSGEFTIPPKVTYLDNIFYEAYIPKLIIPNTVTGGYDNCLSNAYITELVWDSTANIPYELAENNTYLQKLTITKDINYIDNDAFYGCTNLKEVTAKNIKERIYSYAFRDCTSLTSFTAGYIRSIDGYAFYNDTALTTMDARCTYQIGDSAFYNCSNLTNINKLIENVMIISGTAFNSCSSLGDVKLGGSTSQIGQYAFRYSGITHLDATNAVELTSVGSYAFDGCDKLEEVSNWNSPGYQYLFRNCTALEKFTFGPNCTTLSNANYMFSGCSALTDIYWLNPNPPSSISYLLMYNTPNTETIHYYKPESGTDTWQNYYNNYGSSYTFQLDQMPASTEPVAISIDWTVVTAVNIKIGETIQLSATITYSDGTTVAATADNATWSSDNPEYLIVDENGVITGLKSPGDSLCVVSVRAKGPSTAGGIGITVRVTNETVGDDGNLSATKVELNELYIDGNYVYAPWNNPQYIDKPFAMDRYNDGINTNSYSHITYYVYPHNSSDAPKIEVIEGNDIVSVSEPELSWIGDSYDCFKSNITHLTDDQGNYQYGTVTFKVTAGNAEPMVYSFELERESLIPNGASFDNSQYQSNYTLEVGKSYDYTAFPTSWNGSDPYMWYEVTYSVDNTDLADLVVNVVEDAVYDVNTDSYYTARVATLTPKKAGTIKLRAHSGRLVNNYTEITLTITDPNNVGGPVVRPDESGNPDEIWATSINFQQNPVTLVVGTTQTLTPVIKPANSNDELTYYSLDKTIASVNADTGVVTANAVGETTIGVSTSSGLNATVKVVVVTAEVKTETMTIPETITMKEGDTVTLEITRTPADTTDSIMITTDDEGVVKVVDGRLVAVGEGTATITVTSGDVSKTCAVTITKAATGITLDQTSAELKKGETLQLTATLEPAGVTDEIKWTSSNEKIATVSDTGLVTTTGYGNVTITATVNSTYSATCTIFVAPNLDFKILGASIRMTDPYGIRFGIQLGKNGDYGNVEIVEYGTVMLPTEKLAGEELNLSTKNVLRVKGEVIYSETNSELVYTGVLINIPDSFFGTNVSGRGYLVYKDTAGAQHTIYTDVVSRSFTGVAQAAYDSYSKIENPTQAQQAILDKLKEILGL